MDPHDSLRYRSVNKVVHPGGNGRKKDRDTYHDSKWSLDLLRAACDTSGLEDFQGEELRAAHCSNVHHLSAMRLILTVRPTQPRPPAPKLLVVTFKMETSSSQGSVAIGAGGCSAGSSSVGSSSCMPACMPASGVLAWEGKLSQIRSRLFVRKAASTARENVRLRP